MQGSGKGGGGDKLSGPLTALQQDASGGQSVGLTPIATGYSAADTSQYPPRGAEPDYLGYLPGSQGQPPISSPEYSQTAYTGAAEAGAKPEDPWWKRAAKGAGEWGRTGSRLSQGGGSIGGLPSIDAIGPYNLRPNPAFPLTPGQSKILSRLGIPPDRAQTFIANQIMSGNPSYGPYTAQQVAAARSLTGGGGQSLPPTAE